MGTSKKIVLATQGNRTDSIFYKEVLDQEKLPGLLDLKYHTLGDAIEKLGSISQIR